MSVVGAGGRLGCGEVASRGQGIGARGIGGRGIGARRVRGRVGSGSGAGSAGDGPPKPSALPTADPAKAMVAVASAPMEPAPMAVSAAAISAAMMKASSSSRARGGADPDEAAPTGPDASEAPTPSADPGDRVSGSSVDSRRRTHDQTPIATSAINVESGPTAASPSASPSSHLQALWARQASRAPYRAGSTSRRSDPMRTTPATASTTPRLAIRVIRSPRNTRASTAVTTDTGTRARRPPRASSGPARARRTGRHPCRPTRTGSGPGRLQAHP